MTTAYPLAWPQGWPRAQQRKRAKFSKGERQYSTVPGSNGSWVHHREITIADGTARVLAELQALKVPHGEAIISTNLELRLDGLPRSGQRMPDDPGVAVYWRKPGEPMKVMAIDIYDRVADNLAAVAATLNAMRAIERHGGAQILERAFTGFAALPPPKQWWETLGFKVKPTLLADAEQRFRTLAKVDHPDAGGSRENFEAITDAISQARKELGR